MKCEPEREDHKTALILLCCLCHPRNKKGIKEGDKQTLAELFALAEELRREWNVRHPKDALKFAGEDK